MTATDPIARSLLRDELTQTHERIRELQAEILRYRRYASEIVLAQARGQSWLVPTIAAPPLGATDTTTEEVR
jgi:hypothetical protein